MIKKIGGKYFVFSEGGRRLSKGYASHGEATKRLQQVEYFKHKEKK